MGRVVQTLFIFHFKHCIQMLYTDMQSLYRIEAENSAKYMPPDAFFSIQIFVKINFGRGSIPDPAGGAYLTTLPQTP